VSRGLDGKVVVVTGAGGGIGAGTSARLASEGATVVLTDVSPDSARAAAKEITAAGGRAEALELDIGDAGMVAAVIDDVAVRHGRLDGLHNNAADLSEGNLGLDGDLLEVPLEVWRRTMDVSLTGAMLCCRHAIPHMLAIGGGSIVNTSSDAAFLGEPRFAAYSVAKTGILALTRHIASRWGKDGIRCNAITPGLVLTDAASELVGQEWISHQLAITRSTRLGRPSDIAAMVAMLMSDDGEWINGQTYAVNGGTTIR
jgi:NAD(P)-dependent dehydrogenase (short-subunit alcohol dehydrogenase family)